MTRASGVVNTTPIGMAKYPGMPFVPICCQPRQMGRRTSSISRRETELLAAARCQGCRTLPGTGMAVYQAVRAFELFTGPQADREAMAGHFEAAA